MEPVGRGIYRASPIALAALLESENDPLILVLAADHVISDQDAFTDCYEGGSSSLSRSLSLSVSFPQKPHTGYESIEAGQLSDSGYSVASFQEKPDSDTAAKYPW